MLYTDTKAPRGHTYPAESFTGFRSQKQRSKEKLTFNCQHVDLQRCASLFPHIHLHLKDISLENIAIYNQNVNNI